MARWWRLILAVGLLGALPLAAAEKFRVKYFLDKDDESLGIIELNFLTARRAVAIGQLDTNKRRYGVMLSTSDGGETWQSEPLKDLPRSLFFLNDSLGWMVTERGVWQTEEGGRSWRKLSGEQSIARVHFLDAQRGFAVGALKKLLATKDGGKTWAKVPAGDLPETRPDFTVYSQIVSPEPNWLLVAGTSIPPRRQSRRDLPPWLEPEEAKHRTQRPTVMLVVESRDGGVTWRHGTTSMFGRIAKVTVGAGKVGLGIFQFDDQFDWPAEVYKLTLNNGRSTRVFRYKDRLVTDGLIEPDGSAYLAAIEPATEVRGIPIPGKVHIHRSRGSEMDLWAEVPVDYRAVASRATLARSPDGSMWLVTSAGMILKLEDR
ncbi:MAG: hypothetical protein NTZ56_06605 [Acidobacteria bacterium]|nr:hypothetical protein [Acidobacteriota bacterium]